MAADFRALQNDDELPDVRSLADLRVGMNEG